MKNIYTLFLGISALLNAPNPTHAKEILKSTPFAPTPNKTTQSTIPKNSNHTAQNPNQSLAASFGTDLEPYAHSLGLGYAHSYMQTDSFSIQTIGAQLQYTHSAPKYRGIYQLHIAHSTLKPNSTNATQSPQLSQEALHIGLFSAFDIGFASTQIGGILLGIEGGIGSGIAKEANNSFDESSLLLNADIGYMLKLDAFSQHLRNEWLKKLLIYPYLRFEQYIFLPHSKASKDRLDYGLNGILGVKIIGDFRAFDWCVNFGILSDFDASGNGIGILGDNSIVFDRNGISNGVLADIGINLLNHRAFALQGRFSLNYALNYYELNLKGSLVGIWQF